MATSLSIRDSRVKKVRDALNDSPLLEVDELAKKVELSRSRLDKLFKQHVGIGLGDYIRRRRLELAAGLLRSSDSRVKEIALSTGYEHTSSFVRAFKQSFGITPSGYRRGRIAKNANE